MSKRARGEGNIRMRSDGRWEGRVIMPEGRRRSVYGKTQAEVVRAVRELHQALDRGLPVPSALRTVADVIDAWLDGSARLRLSPTTLRAYRHYAEAHLKPSLGRLRLARLAPEDIDHFLADKAEGGLKPQTCVQMRAILRSALAWAEKRGWVARNAAALSDMPRVERTPLRPFEADELRQLRAGIEGDRLEALYLLALDSGMRQGELLGLRWLDIDLDERTLRISRTRLAVPGKEAAFAEPKSVAGLRSIALSAASVAALRQHRARQASEQLQAGPSWSDSGLVFTTTTGKALQGSTVSHAFDRKLRALGMRHQRFHDLRHASATHLIMQGVPPKVVSERLGHSQVHFTLDTYTHVVDGMQHQAASVMDALLTRRAAGG